MNILDYLNQFLDILEKENMGWLIQVNKNNYLIGLAKTSNTETYLFPGIWCIPTSFEDWHIKSIYKESIELWIDDFKQKIHTDKQNYYKVL